jgi:hypothetical protein
MAGNKGMFSASTRATVASLEHLAVGDAVPDMPLFLTNERCVNLSLGSTSEIDLRGRLPRQAPGLERLPRGTVA